MPKKYIIELSCQERQMLDALVSKGRVLAQERTHAQILLKADEGAEGEAWKDEQIAEGPMMWRSAVWSGFASAVSTMA